MTERKPLLWFLAITFAISWILFLTPLALPETIAPDVRQGAIVGLWALAMWGPGIGAILATVAIARQPFRTLALNRLGPKRYYLWAWFLPPLLSIVAGVFTLLLGFGRLDTEFTLMRDALAQTPGAQNIPPGLIVGAQIAAALTLAPFINVIFALGEELGWRGFLLPRLLPLGQWQAILLSGVIWGLWHAPAVAQGLNYPGYPVLGIFMMTIFTILLGCIFSWLYLNTRSTWAPALAHGSVNASAGLSVLFLQPGVNLALGGTLASISGWIGLALFVVWLIITRRLPVANAVEEVTSEV